MRLKRRRPNYDKIKELERSLGIPIWEIAQKEYKAHFQWFHPLRWSLFVLRIPLKIGRVIIVSPLETLWDYFVLDLEDLVMFLIMAIVIIMPLGGIAFGIYTLANEPKGPPPPPLPAHVMITQNETFVVDKGYGALGIELCYDHDIEGIYHLGNKEIITCKEGSNEFSYPKSKIWHGPV